jgi:predicted enzyme related to lactoylglutathione lyase
MIRKINYIILLVDEQERALDFYTEKMGFEQHPENTLNKAARWVVVAPKGPSDFGLILQRADTDEKKAAIGLQAGGGVLMIVQTNDCVKTHKDLKSKGIEFEGTPQERPWGMEVVFKDLYGNRFTLLQPKGWS